MRFDLEVTGVEDAERRLIRYGERASDLRPVGDEIIREFAEGERRLFASAVGFKPLKRSTKERKRRQRLPLKPMHASGLLADTLGSTGAKARRHGQLNRVGKTEVRFGIKPGRSDIFYGAISQKGRKNQVSRKVVVLTPTTARGIKRVVLRRVTGRTR